MDKDMNHRATQHPSREWLNSHSNLIVYSFLTLVVILAFVLDGLNQKADQKNRCLAAVDTRNVDRAQVQAFYVFVNGFLPSDTEAKKLPKADQKQIAQTRTRLTTYRTDLFKQIHPSDACKPYVDDDNVKPPKSPNVSIIPKKEQDR